MTGVFDDHLSLDAIVAYADGEMSLTAYQRAAAHVMRCAMCAADVAEQTAASQYIRQASLPSMPGSLFDTLRSIPVALPQAGPVAGVMVDSASGRTVRTHESSWQGRGRRFRLGAGALVAGIAVGAAMVAAAGEHPATTPAGSFVPDASSVSRPSPALHTTVVNAAVRSSTTR
jgi:anti-sigma factor RsiW